MAVHLAPHKSIARRKLAEERPLSCMIVATVHAQRRKAELEEFVEERRPLRQHVVHQLRDAQSGAVHGLVQLRRHCISLLNHLCFDGECGSPAASDLVGHQPGA